MVEKFNGFKSKQGGLFLSEVLENLCEIIPEFQMVRPRLEANLDAIAAAVGPMLDFRRRVPSPGPIGCCVNTPRGQDHHTDCPSHPDYDHGELAGTCDCSAGMNGASDHARSCPSYRPVAGLALAHG